MGFPDLTDVPDDALLQALGSAPWGAFDPAVDARALRDRLLRASGDARSFALHQFATHARLAVPRLQRRGISSLAARADGRLLAVGGEGAPDGYGHASVSIWDLDLLRIVHSFHGFMGPVGWGGEPDCLQWLPRGDLVFSHATNRVSWFRTFGGPDPVETWGPDDTRDTPPGFVVGPGQVFISAWAPGDAAGCIVDMRQGSTPRWVGHGATEPPWSVRWVGGEILGHSERQRVVIDAPSGRLLHEVAGRTLAWSPSGRWVIVGDQVRDARTDQVRFALPSGEPRRHGGAFECGFLDDDTVYAVATDHVDVVAPNRYTRIDVGVARPRVSRPGDVRTVVASPGGRRLAVLGDDGHVYVFERDGTPVHGGPGGPIGGVRWAGESRLIGASDHHLSFFDGDGRLLLEQSMLPGVGRTAPEPRAVPGDRATTVVRDRRGDRSFAAVEPTVVRADPATYAVLLPELAWRVGETAWPAEWMPPARLPALPPVPPREGPHLQRYVPPPTDRGLTAERIRTTMPQGVPAPTWPVEAYRTSSPLVGPQITEAALQGLKGRLVLWATTGRPEYPRYGVLVWWSARPPGEWMYITAGPHGGDGSGPLDPSELAWIGLAEPA